MVVFSTLSYVVLEAPSTSGPLCQMLPDLYDLGVDTYMVSLILKITKFLKSLKILKSLLKSQKETFWLVHGFSVASWSLDSFF